MRRRTGLALGAAALALAAGLYLAKAEADRRRDRIGALATERALLDAEVRTLEGEAAYEGRAARVDELAREQGLTPATTDQQQRAP